MPAQAAADDPWSGRIEAGVIAASRTSDAEDLDSSAIYGRAELHFDRDAQPTGFKGRAFSSYYDYFTRARHNRFSNGVSGALIHQLSDRVAFEVGGAYSSNLITTEALEADQLEGRATLVFEPDKKNRIETFGAIRRRDYDDSADRLGHGGAVGTNYRYHFGSYRYAGASLQRDWIDCANQFREYRRWTLEAYLSAPVSGSTLVRGTLSYRDIRFPGRPIALPGSGSRHDHQLVSELMVTQPLTHALRLEVGGRYILRSSNDPGYRKDGIRGQAALQYRF
ncbi:MAG: hypothetical protein H0W71_03755 [Sphingomonas sp.]|nr:hypothetical protein [Sphingomonas sp.]